MSYRDYSKQFKRRAIALRRAGWSVPQIATDLGLSKSTAFLWVRQVPVSRDTLKALEQRIAAGRERGGGVSRLRADAIIAAAVAEAKGQWKELSRSPEFMLGIGIYMGEGNKRSCALGLTNSDEGIIKTWIRWCKAFAPDRCFRARAMVHGHEQIATARVHWERVLHGFAELRGISAHISVASKRRRAVDRLPHGTITIDMCHGSRAWHAKMMEWIRLASTG